MAIEEARSFTLAFLPEREPPRQPKAAATPPKTGGELEVRSPL